MNILNVAELYALAPYFTCINRYDPLKTAEMQLCARKVQLQMFFFPGNWDGALQWLI